MEVIPPYWACLFVFWAGFIVLFVNRVFPASFCVAKSPKKSRRVSRMQRLETLLRSWEKKILNRKTSLLL